MANVIAIDFDGTLANTGVAKSRYLKENFALSIAPKDCRRVNYLSKIGETAYTEMANFVYGRESTLNTEIMPGAAAVVQELVLNADLYVVTARNPEQTECVVTWLIENGLKKHFKGVIGLDGRSTKASVCNRINAAVMIDDYQKHLESHPIHRTLILFGAESCSEHTFCTPAENWRVVREILSVVLEQD